MNWSTTPPTEPGWYFHRDFADSVPQVLYVVNDDYADEVWGGEWWPERIKEPEERT